MPERDAAPETGFLELLASAAQGVFPVLLLEALIARREGAK